MPNLFEMTINQNDLKGVIRAFKTLGDKAIPMLEKVMDYGAAQVAKNAKQNHFFVGTGYGSSKIAANNVFTFKNPDGTPRFKVHTANLINSIHEVGAVVTGSVVVARVVAGMQYARAVEEGGPGRRAFPYMRPALEQTRADIIRVMKEQLRLLLKQAKG